MKSEWKKVTLGDLISVSQGYTFKPEFQGVQGEKWQYFKVADIGLSSNKKYLITALNSISEEIKQFLKIKEFPAGSIAFPRVGAALLNNNKKILFQDSIVDDNTIVITPHTATINNEFLYYWFLTKQLKDFCNDGPVPVISSKNIKSSKILLPPILEQEKIAKTLSVWDSAIEKIEKLIFDKERMFSFLMKKILSKKENTCYLNKIVTIKKGNQLNKENMISNGTVPVLNGGIFYSGFTNFANTQKNTIAISEGGNSCGYVNFVSEDFWAGGHCYTLELKNKDVETKFLYWMLKSKEKEIMKLRVGSGLPNIQQNDLCNLKIEIYNKNDQLKIIELLDCQQREISLLKKQLEQYKLQKQGLMQKLLTGEWRIK